MVQSKQALEDAARAQTQVETRQQQASDMLQHLTVAEAKESATDAQAQQSKDQIAEATRKVSPSVVRWLYQM